MVYTTKTIFFFHCVHHEYHFSLSWCTPRNYTTEGENGSTLSPANPDTQGIRPVHKSFQAMPQRHSMSNFYQLLDPINEFNQSLSRSVITDLSWCISSVQIRADYFKEKRLFDLFQAHAGGRRKPIH